MARRRLQLAPEVFDVYSVGASGHPFSRRYPDAISVTSAISPITFLTAALPE